MQRARRFSTVVCLREQMVELFSEDNSKQKYDSHVPLNTPTEGFPSIFIVTLYFLLNVWLLKVVVNAQTLKSMLKLLAKRARVQEKHCVRNLLLWPCE